MKSVVNIFVQFLAAIGCQIIGLKNFKPTKQGRNRKQDSTKYRAVCEPTTSLLASTLFVFTLSPLGQPKDTLN